MKTMNQIGMAAVGVMMTAMSALGQSPTLGGPMKHAMVHSDNGTDLMAMVDQNVATPSLNNTGVMYAGAANVLNGQMINAQYGWMVEGVLTLPSGGQLWIEQVSATPGLSVYRGSGGGFVPIFGTSGSSQRIAWSGTMLHNWYAVSAAGDYQATYRVYIGDSSGEAMAGYGEATVTFNWTSSVPGACCNAATGVCVLTVTSMCGPLGGSFLGVGTACGPNPCIAAPVCRADFDHSGGVDVQDIFEFLNTWFAGCP